MILFTDCVQNKHKNHSNVSPIFTMDTMDTMDIMDTRQPLNLIVPCIINAISSDSYYQ